MLHIHQILLQKKGGCMFKTFKMWDFEIEKILNTDKNFIGCFPHDKLPNIKNKLNCSIIINTGDSGTEGKHWVAVKMTKNKCFYFDSFGVKIEEENIKRFVSMYDKVLYSNICIQDIRSKKCGEFCIAFINKVNNIVQLNYPSLINQVFVN